MPVGAVPLVELSVPFVEFVELSGGGGVPPELFVLFGPELFVELEELDEMLK